MNFTACPVCGQVPTYVFDFRDSTVQVAHHVCMTAGRPPR